MNQYMIVEFDRYNAKDSTNNVVEAKTAQQAFKSLMLSKLHYDLLHEFGLDKKFSSSNMPTVADMIADGGTLEDIQYYKEGFNNIKEWIKDYKLKKGKFMYGCDDEEVSYLVIKV